MLNREMFLEKELWKIEKEIGNNKKQINWPKLQKYLMDIQKTFSNPNTKRFEKAISKIDDNSFKSLKELIPWRKGPINIYDIKIDAEWQSNLKWDRLNSVYKSLKDRKILDIGCGNGYYMYRMLEHKPKFILGIDPSQLCFYQFFTINKYKKANNIYFLPMGLEKLDAFDKYFDVVFCMGILYHRRSPLDALKTIKNVMARKSTLVLETLFYPGEEEIAFCPKKRYAKMHNVYFIPTINCLLNWLENAGFNNLEVISTTKTTTEEQRKTEWMPWESLSDFLDPNDHSKTIEGYPAPQRVIITANC
ncbi:tRNA 5-methoxyuridine(34)/uridine 5-oxyacetic acid(34) synthase CmoB [Candidatus Margulisiibacteriota bacterium]